MNVSSGNRIQTADVGPTKNKIGVLVAQRSLEAARQNQESDGIVQGNKSKIFAHPFLGHNVDIYV